MKKCPKCGTAMDNDQKHCLTCDYVEKHPKKVCPVCGDALVRGICYRCGHRKTSSHNTCPYCHEKLIGGRCDRCKYISGRDDVARIIWVMIVVGIILGILIGGSI